MTKIILIYSIKYFILIPVGKIAGIKGSKKIESGDINTVLFFLSLGQLPCISDYSFAHIVALLSIQWYQSVLSPSKAFFLSISPILSFPF